MLEQIILNKKGNSVLEIKKDTRIVEKEAENVLLKIDSNVNVEYIIINKNANNVSRNAELKKDSHILWIDVNINSTNSSIKTEINGENSSSITKSLFIGDSVANIETTHNAENTKSELMTKCVLFNNNKDKIKGLIRINRNAKNSKGKQKKEILLLGENIQIETAPNLEIKNNEVECSHGCSIENINEDSLFYLMSRGLNEIDAKKEIIRGFMNSVVSDLDVELLNEVNIEINKKLETLK